MTIMTLVLTCVTHDYIVQAADRRLTCPDGTIYDDDTTKAVFFCGRVAVAYTGPARLDERPTSEWIAFTMKDAVGGEAAINEIASRATVAVRAVPLAQRRFAAIATGWATLRGGDPLRPFVSVASNYLSGFNDWLPVARANVDVQTFFLDQGADACLFVAGQRLMRPESISLDRYIRRAVRRRSASPFTLARLLGETIRGVSLGADARSTTVGCALIIQSLVRQATLNDQGMLVTPLDAAAHSFLYVASDGRTDRFKGADIACNGAVLTSIGGGTIPPGGKGSIRTEAEESARREPIVVGAQQTSYSAVCPFCAAEPHGPRTMVTGELEPGIDNHWVYCQGDVGHLLLVTRQAADAGA